MDGNSNYYTIDIRGMIEVRKYEVIRMVAMKKISLILTIILIVSMLCSCASTEEVQIAATTLPVYEFTSILCQGTDLTVGRLVTENVSCLHDYTLQVGQMRMIESAQVIVLSGLGLEDFLSDALEGKEQVIDASQGIAPICPEEEHAHDHGHDGHSHENDPHIWLSPENTKIMASNICAQLSLLYPQQETLFRENLKELTEQLDQLQSYGEETLSDLSCRELVTFHDGFAYFADCFDLHILEAVEEESGREASARELIHLIEEVEHHSLPAIFTEKSGSVSAAGIIARETGCESYSLDMAMAGDSYFEAMYHNIDTVKEALG